LKAITIHTMLSLKEIELIEESWCKLSNIATVIITHDFYEHLFEKHPETKLFFKMDLQVLKQKLADTLDVLIQNIRNFDALVPQLKTMGQKHDDINIKSGHYTYVKDSLLFVLSKRLGKDFNEDTKLAWGKLLDLVSEKMIEGEGR